MKVMVLVHNGFEEAEMIVATDIMRRAGIEANIFSMTGNKMLVGNKNIKVEADDVLGDSIDAEKYAKEYDGVVLPGGGPNAFSLKDDVRANNLVVKFNEKGKLVAAICAAPIVLEKVGIIANKTVTSYTGMLDSSKCNYILNAKSVKDGNIITSCGPAACLEFGYAIVKELCGEKISEKLKKEMLY